MLTFIIIAVPIVSIIGWYIWENFIRTKDEILRIRFREDSSQSSRFEPFKGCTLSYSSGNALGKSKEYKKLYILGDSGRLDLEEGRVYTYAETEQHKESDIVLMKTEVGGYFLIFGKYIKDNPIGTPVGIVTGPTDQTIP